MNRENRRKFEKMIKSKNPQLYEKIKLKENISEINENDEILLDVDLILEDKERTNAKFIAFVENSRGTVFHAKPIDKLHFLIGIQEAPFIFFHEEVVKM